MIKVGIYVDSENIRLNGGFGMRYDVLMEHAKRESGVVLRANAYVIEDEERMQQDPEHASKLTKYFSILRSMGFKLIKKKAKRYRNDATGEVQTKANVDMDLAIDAVLQSDNLDRIILLTGDGDFSRLVQALQNKGCRVDVIAFRNVSRELIGMADSYTSGYLLPKLLPMIDEVRTCRGYPNGDKVLSHGYGFFATSCSDKEFAGKNIFFHVSQLVNVEDQDKLESSKNIFEFNLKPSERRDGDMEATDIILVAENVHV